MSGATSTKHNMPCGIKWNVPFRCCTSELCFSCMSIKDEIACGVPAARRLRFSQGPADHAVRFNVLMVLA